MVLQKLTTLEISTSMSLLRTPDPVTQDNSQTALYHRGNIFLFAVSLGDVPLLVLKQLMSAKVGRKYIECLT